ncbi:MAG: DUF3987 domain-containing protein, partial [Azonexus sp.]|nr:DUF3987 domain-containing protein [Azonexus sp.]
MSDRSDFNDLAREAGAAAVAEVIAKAQAAPTSKPVVEAATNSESLASIGENWPDPIIPGRMPVPDIPATLLPSWLGRMAKAVSESTQTPPAMAVMCSISVLATVLQRRFEVAPFGEDD